MLKKMSILIGTLVVAGTCLRAEEMKSAAKKEGSAAPAQVTEVTVIRPNISPEMIRHAVTQNRRALFEAAFEDLLTDASVKSAFWQVYDAYESEKAGVADSRMAIVSEYVKNFFSMSDAKVKELVKSSYKNQSKELKIRNKYAGQLMKKTNPTIAGRFWQVDDFVSSAVKLSLLANVPLLGENVKYRYSIKSPAGSLFPPRGFAFKPMNSRLSRRDGLGFCRARFN